MLHANSHNYTKFGDQNGDHDRNKVSNSIRFTDISIRHLKAKNKRITYWSQGLIGFGIRVSINGSKTWVYKYRFNKTQKMVTIGQYPQISLSKAKSLYCEALEQVKHGIDPLMKRKKVFKKEQDELTVSQLIDLYLDHGRKSKKTSVETERKCLEKDIIPVIGYKKISLVEPKQLARVFHDIIVNREAPSTATHLYSYVRRLFNFASDMGLMRRRDNPCLDIKLKIKKNRRSRHLNPQEIYRFWTLLEKIPTTQVTRLALKFMLVTLARGCEVRCMKWSDINFKSRVWTLPKTKNGHMHRVYLNDLAMNILSEVKEYSDGKGIVFGSTGKFKNRHKIKEGLKPMHGRTMCQPIKRHFEKFQIEEHFTPHDLRRTGATIIASLFGRKDLVKMCLNHVSNDVTDIYDQYTYAEEKKMAMNALNRALQIIIHSKDVESIPSFEDLRQIVIEGRKEPNVIHQKPCKTVEFQASFSSPVSYKLSFDHDMLSDVA
jgi:integrase